MGRLARNEQIKLAKFSKENNIQTQQQTLGACTDCIES